VAEEVVGALHEDTLLGATLGAVPPRSDEVGQQDAEKTSVEEDEVLAIAVGDNKLGQGDADAEALLAVGVAKLDVVVADVLVGESLVSLCELDVVVVERLCRLVFGRIGAGLVGMELD
jgi:hypothetical protein